MSKKSTKRFTVLIVEDEDQVRGLLRECLEIKGYQVIEAGTGADALAKAVKHRPDAVFVDLGLPDMDGLSVIKRLRECSKVPIMVVSGRDYEESKVEALDGGADDYVTKPFSMAEIMARLRVAQRHSQPAQESPTFRSGALEVDLSNRLVKVNGETVKLTATEYSLLALFVRHAGKVLTHSQILRQIWGPEGAGQTGYLRVYMAHLRGKLEPNPGEPELFITESGVGYRLIERE